MPGLRISTSVVEDTATLRAMGDVDVMTARQFRSALATALLQHPRVVVDLTQCSFFDSSAMQVLLTFADQLGEIVVPHDGPLANKLEIAALDQILPVRTI